jgi:hypothetical protein
MRVSKKKKKYETLKKTRTNKKAGSGKTVAKVAAGKAKAKAKAKPAAKKPGGKKK